MSDPDRRGAEPPLTLDSRRRPSRGRGPAPVTLIVSLLLLVIVAGGVFYMYRSGARHAGDAPQPLGAPLGDVRAPAPPQAQTPDAAAGLTISKDDPNAAPAPATLAPPPEQPLPEPAPPQAASAAPPPPPPPAPGDKPTKADKADSIDALIAESAKPSVKPAKPVKPATEAKPATDASGTFVVQIGAFSSQSLADREWSKAAAVAPGSMAGKGKRVAAVDKDGATLYRTAITGFTSREAAQALCDRLAAAGGKCFVR